jgi:dTDP-4-amino-4,6-dideoxygalactose transaminase
MIPFLDLKVQYDSIKDEIDAAIQQVLSSCAFAGGPFVEQFEKEFAALCQCQHAIGVGSGTEALWLTLLALGIGTGMRSLLFPILSSTRLRPSASLAHGQFLLILMSRLTI